MNNFLPTPQRWNTESKKAKIAMNSIKLCRSSQSISLTLLFFAATAQAGTRTSTNYIVSSDTTDGGGKRATSTNYTNDGSAGGIVGISTVATPAETVKGGYVAQLYDVSGLTLTAVTLDVNEIGTNQLAAWQALDDLSLLAVPVGSVTWSVPSGPLTINASGLAEGGAVFRNTAAMAQGIYAGNTGTLSLTVINTMFDNFGSYADDSLEDAWQVQYFGLNNPLAAPGVDSDQDGFDNQFEFAAGTVPTDPASVFHWRMESVSGQIRLVFSPRFTDRTYTVKTSTSLQSATWIPLNGAIVTDNGNERTVTTPSTAGQRMFYKVEVSKP